jgi:hypothetical protein
LVAARRLSDEEKNWDGYCDEGDDFENHCPLVLLQRGDLASWSAGSSTRKLPFLAFGGYFLSRHQRACRAESSSRFSGAQRLWD